MNKENIDDCKRVALALLASLPAIFQKRVANETTTHKIRRVGFKAVGNQRGVGRRGLGANNIR